jgi:hypothetical protein
VHSAEEPQGLQGNEMIELELEPGGAKGDEKEPVSQEDNAVREVSEVDIPDGTLRSGHRFRIIEAANLTQHPLEFTSAETTFYKYMNMRVEVGCVGAGVDGGLRTLRSCTL